MMPILTILDPRTVNDLGWTLFHSLWEISVVALALWLVLRLIPAAASNLRYAASVAALGFCFILPLVTYLQISNGSALAHAATQLDRDLVEDGSEIGKPPALAYSNGGSSDITALQSRSNGVAGLESARDLIAEQLTQVFPFALTIWVAGFLLYSLWMFGGIYTLRRLRKQYIVPIDSDWQERFEKLTKRLNVSQRVRLICSRSVATPIAVGVFRSTVIIPFSVMSQLDPCQLEIIIAHELVHIRRHDVIISMLQNGIEAILFYHPAMWWISHTVRLEREFAADAAVMRVSGGDGVVYAKALADLEDIRLLTNKTAPSMAMAANGGNFMQRIERILNERTEIPRAYSAWSAGLAIVVISALLLVVFSFTPQGLVNGQQRTAGRKVAIGFVSIPPLDRSDNPPKDADATARILIAKLQQHKVPAIGFLTGGMISDGEKLFPVRANIVKLWRDAGFEIGIGGFKHLPFQNATLDEYIANVEKNERIARQILGEKNIQLRYFSYPYLYTRKNDEHQRFEKWLTDRGLTSVKYTIDNNEWMYSYAYDMARNDNDVNTMKEIQGAFINYMGRMFDHYEAYSQETFGRNIPETMVLTPSRLVADSADELFAMIEKRGYKFVSMGNALRDEAFNTPESYEGDNGISWYDRWTLTAGKRLKDEPQVDPLVQKIWNDRKTK